MSTFTYYLCLLLVYLPGYTTPLEDVLLADFGYNRPVWDVAIQQGIVKPWDVPMWALTSTDDRCRAGGYGRIYTYRERSGFTLNYIRLHRQGRL